ncbi:dihydrofolate reductase [Cardiobacteriaceae bacterium TAE3-ERU3]|nr:dihydrofolate reductase [Cardiobacteriaceae bacterium TAE3-ERU3]
MNKAEINLIVAQSNNRVIGRDGDMPWHLPRDLKWFKSHTSGYPVIMGRNTYQSIGKALPNRRNIVISSADPRLFPDAETVRSLDEALMSVQQSEKAFIIGGGQLYKTAMALADRLIVTHIDTTIDDGDTFFPVIHSEEWQLVSEEQHAADEKNPLDIRFCIYERKGRSI